MALQASLGKYRTELAESASRAFNRPSSSTPARTSTPKPAEAKSAVDSTKRSHDTAFSQPLSTGSGNELLTQVLHAVERLKEKGSIMTFDDIVRFLSLPVDAQKNIPNIRHGLIKAPRVQHLSASESGNGKESFKYKPLHPVTNGEELKLYLQRQPTAQGISVKDLKDGWPDCITIIDQLESEHWVLVIRHKKDNTPKFVWMDNPEWHIKVSPDFVDFVVKTKLPATENEIRNELEKAGLTPTSQVKETRKLDNKKRERKKPNRRGGKTTNAHMAGILKDYSKR